MCLVPITLMNITNTVIILNISSNYKPTYCIILECGLLDFVEAPEDYVRTRKQYGAWFMDSESSDDRVWVMEHFFKNKKIFEYNSLSDLLGNG